MRAQQIMDRLRDAGYQIEVSPSGDKLRIRPASVPDDLLEQLRQCKEEVIDRLRAAANDEISLEGLPVDPDGGAFTPWYPRVTPAQLAAWRSELWASVAELADLEQWSDSTRDEIAYCLDCGPASAVRDDLVHFRERLTQARSSKGARA